ISNPTTGDGDGKRKLREGKLNGNPKTLSPALSRIPNCERLGGCHFPNPPSPLDLTPFQAKQPLLPYLPSSHLRRSIRQTKCFFFSSISRLDSSPHHSVRTPLPLPMAAAAAGASIRWHYSSSFPATPRTHHNRLLPSPTTTSLSFYSKRLAPAVCSLKSSDSTGREGNSFSFKECAVSFALAVGLITGAPSMADWCPDANAVAVNPALPDVAVLISGPPIKDPGALLRYALPIDNKAIREVQKPLEDITDSLKIAGLKALDSVERNVRQASRALKQGKSLIIAGLAEPKRAQGGEVLDKLETGLDELQQIVESRNRDGVAPKQKELLDYVGS
ncbi:unnamed protein product, partial [Linum tenue]